MWRITAPSLAVLALLTGTMAAAVVWVAEEPLPPIELLPSRGWSDPAVLDALLTGAWNCITDAELRDGLVTSEFEDDGRWHAWQVDQDGQRRLWVQLRTAEADWCTPG